MHMWQEAEAAGDPLPVSFRLGSEVPVVLVEAAKQIAEELLGLGFGLVRTSSAKPSPSELEGDPILVAFDREGDSERLCRVLRRLAARSPILILAQNPTPQSLESLFCAGADDFLVWPDERRLLGARMAILARRAEERQKSKKAPSPAPSELERIDITDRKLAEEALQVNEEALSDFFENAVVGIHWLGPDGRILRSNRAELEMLGYRREEYVGHHIFDFHADPENVEDMLRRLARGEVLRRYEARLVCRDGSIKHVLVDSNGRREGDRFVYSRCFTRDVSEQKRAEEALRESEAKLRTILENTTEGIFTFNEAGLLESFNPAALQLFGHAAADVVGHPVSILFSPPSARAQLSIDEYLRSLGHVIGGSRETLGRHRDGSTFPMEFAFSVATVGSERLFTAIVRDISERRQLERQVLEVSEELQMRIGQDLHDGIGQQLTGIAFIAKGLEQTTSKEQAASAARVVELINQAIGTVRRLAKGLSPLHLEQRSLTSLLGELVEGAHHLFGVTTTFGASGEVDADSPKLKTQIYLITQEAITNAIRHGRATHIDVSLHSVGDRTTLLITDNGSGLAPPSTGAGVGLRSMQYRARMIGGNLEMANAESGGTTVRCTF